MRRTIPALTFSIFSTFLFVSFIAVYLFHDIDAGQTEQTAYIGLCIEGIFSISLSSGQRSS